MLESGHHASSSPTVGRPGAFGILFFFTLLRRPGLMVSPRSAVYRNYRLVRSRRHPSQDCRASSALDLHQGDSRRLEQLRRESSQRTFGFTDPSEAETLSAGDRQATVGAVSAASCEPRAQSVSFLKQRRRERCAERSGVRRFLIWPEVTTEAVLHYDDDVRSLSFPCRTCC